MEATADDGDLEADPAPPTEEQVVAWEAAGRRAAARVAAAAMGISELDQQAMWTPAYANARAEARASMEEGDAQSTYSSDSEFAAAPDAAAPAEAEPSAPSVTERFVSYTWLSNVHKHVENFAKSGIVDLSERNLVAPEPLECFNTAIAPEIAAGIVHLDLARNSLRTLTSAVLRPLRGLQELDLSYNGMDSFPSAVCGLHTLTMLDLSNNALETLGVSADLMGTGLPQLEVLLLAHNRLTSIPPCLARCGSLLQLDLSSNRLGLGSIGAGGADSTASGNGTGSTPSNGRGPTLARPSSDSSGGGHAAAAASENPLLGTPLLTDLDLSDNGLLRLPSSVFALPLTRLGLSGNRLSVLPAAVRALAPTLSTLEIARNGLRSLPSALGHCVQLKELDVEMNRGLAWPPEEVMRRTLPRILEFLRGNEEPPPPPQRDLEAERAAAAAAAGRAAAEAAARAAKASREAYLAGLMGELHAVIAAHQRAVDRLDEDRTQLAASTADEARSDDEAGRLEAALESRRRFKRAQQEEELQRVREAAAKVAQIPKKHLDELRNLPNPPAAVMQTMQAVHALLEAGEPPSKSTIKGGGSIAAAAKRLGAGVAVSTSDATSRLKAAAKKAGAGATVAPAPPPAPAPPAPPAPPSPQSPQQPTPSATAAGTAAGGPSLASWETVRGKLVGNFVQRVKAFDAAKVSAAACACVSTALPDGPDALASVGKASVACAPLFQWARASLDLAASLLAAAPAKAEMADLEAKLAELRSERAAAHARLAAMRAEGRRLEAEEETMRREVAVAKEAHAAAAAAAKADASGHDDDGETTTRDGAEAAALPLATVEQ